jgi:hypothetical protein
MPGIMKMATMAVFPSTKKMNQQEQTDFWQGTPLFLLSIQNS